MPNALELPVTGTVGILLESKEKRLNQCHQASFRRTFWRIGVRLTASLVNDALQVAGEKH